MNNKSLEENASVLRDPLQHIAFEYPTLDDLLSAFVRLREMGIESAFSAYHSTKTAFYYFDPNGTCIELVAYNFNECENSGESMSMSPELPRVRRAGLIAITDGISSGSQNGLSVGI